MSCKDCLYYEVCPLGLAVNGETGTCLKFKNKADFVEVVHGYWMHEPPYYALNGKYLKASECSNCYAFFVSNGNEPYSDHPYCCECGARMDGKPKERSEKNETKN